jgi:hypothetical protein
MILTLVLVSLPVGASAGSHRAGASAAFLTNTLGSRLNGIQLSFDATLLGEREAHSTGADHLGTLSLLLDTNWVNGDSEGRNLGQATVMGGLRYTFHGLAHTRAQLFVEGTVGQSWELQRESASDAAAFGAGVDLQPLPDHPRVAFRLRYARSWIGARDGEWYNQVSIGLAVRFQ